MQKISAIIVAKNEAHDIMACIESVKNFAEEIIVFDSGSTDGTQDICRASGVKLFETDWPGDGPQKNRALDQATSEWVLCLDADERISAELKTEIISILSAESTHNAFSMPRSSSFCGQFMQHSGWWPDRIVRLFRRGSGRFSELRTHASLEINGSVGKLKGPLIHYSDRDIDEVLQKINVYSTEGALTLYKRGRRSSLSKAIGKSIWAFVRTYIFRLGVLDGRMGLVLAFANSQETYYRYLKLWLLHHPTPSKKTAN